MSIKTGTRDGSQWPTHAHKRRNKAHVRAKTLGKLAKGKPLGYFR